MWILSGTIATKKLTQPIDNRGKRAYKSCMFRALMHTCVHIFMCTITYTNLNGSHLNKCQNTPNIRRRMHSSVVYIYTGRRKHQKIHSPNMKNRPITKGKWKSPYVVPDKTCVTLFIYI